MVKKVGVAVEIVKRPQLLAIWVNCSPQYALDENIAFHGGRAARFFLGAEVWRMYRFSSYKIIQVIENGFHDSCSSTSEILGCSSGEL